MCGVAAWMGEDAYGMVYELLLALQHRGHDAAGAAFPSMGSMVSMGGRGMVYEALPARPGPRAGLVIGHVRYATSGGYTGLYQPVVSSDGRVAAAFNGNIVNYREAAREALGRSVSWDGELVAELLAGLLREQGSLADAVREASRILVGAYSLVAASAGGELVAARDPAGVRPLAYSLGDGYAAVASETGALSALGLEPRELAAGEMLVCSAGGGCGVERYAPATGPYPCAFEYVYLLRPDSVFEGVAAHEARKRMGMLLAGLDTVEADIVAPVPDSGRSAAIGYAAARGLPLDEVLYVDRFRGRAFITSPGARSRRLKRKYSVIPGSVRGKRVVLVDDSIVRGETAAHLARLLRGAGAREIHLRSAAPPVVAPCFFGVDIPTRGELAAARGLEGLAERLGVDSLLYNTVENLVRAIGLPRLCLGCFTGSYPVRLPMPLEELESLFGYTRRRGVEEWGS